MTNSQGCTVPNKLRVADLFCGAGGGSVGVEQSGVASVVYALDQWTDAIDTHKANFPDAKHRCAPIDRVDPREDVPPCDVILASPECTHHSSAAGGIPRDEKLRVTGWDVVQWTEAIRPKWLIVENVKEIQHVGPTRTGWPSAKVQAWRDVSSVGRCDPLPQLPRRVEDAMRCRLRRSHITSPVLPRCQAGTVDQSDQLAGTHAHAQAVATGARDY